MQHMIIFTKAPQSVIGPGAAIKYPHGWSELVDYEAGVLHPTCLFIVVLRFLSPLDQSFLCLFVSCPRACSDHRQTWTRNSEGRCPGPHFWVSALVLSMDVVSEVICETWTRTCMPDKSLPRMVCPFREDCEFWLHCHWRSYKRDWVQVYHSQMCNCKRSAKASPAGGAIVLSFAPSY